MKYYHKNERDENVAVEATQSTYNIGDGANRYREYRLSRERSNKLESESSRHSKLHRKKAFNTAYTAKLTAKSANRAKKGANLIQKSKRGAILALALVGFVAVFMSIIGSCSMLFQGGVAFFGMTTYPSKKSDMFAVEAAYCELEVDLQEQIDNFETDHPGYDEYRVSGTVIGHDPYVLTSLLSAKYGEYTLSSVESQLEAIFRAQYKLHKTVVTETRYRTETRVGYNEVIDEESGEVTYEEYEYEVEVPYDYRIYKVTLEQFDLETLVSQFLIADEITQYNVFMTTKGNYPDLF